MRRVLTIFLILCFVLVTFPQIGVVNAEATIYIRSDGSVEGTDKIQQDRNIYSFTDNIYQSLVVEKDNIIIDGAGHTIEGLNAGLTQQPEGIGIMLERRSNVTIINLSVQNFLYGIYVNSSSENYIINSSITNNSKGIIIEQSSDNTVREIQITNNFDVGIYVFKARDTHIFDNIVADNANDGISLFLSENNEVTYCEIRDNGVGLRIMNSSIRPLIYSCNITGNQVGIHLEASSIHIQFNNIATNEIGIQLNGSDNRIDRNNFINNTKQVYDVAWDNPGMAPSVNAWYDGDSGNYWSDYNGAGDTPYIIDENNQDPLPKNIPFRFPNEPFPHWIEEDFTISNVVWSIVIVAVIGTAFLIYFRRTKNTVKINAVVIMPYASGSPNSRKTIIKLRAVKILEMLTPMKSLKPPFADDFAIPATLLKSEVSNVLLFCLIHMHSLFNIAVSKKVRYPAKTKNKKVLFHHKKQQ